jgi:hypothetical protein
MDCVNGGSGVLAIGQQREVGCLRNAFVAAPAGQRGEFRVQLVLVEAACSSGKDSQGKVAERFGMFELGCDVAPSGKLELYGRPLARLSKDCGSLVGLPLGQITDPAVEHASSHADTQRSGMGECSHEPHGAAGAPGYQTAALVGVRGVGQHDAADLIWVRGGEHSTCQPTVGVADQEIGARQPQFLQGGVQTVGRVPRVKGVLVRPGVAPAEPGTIVGNDGGELGDGRLNPAPLGGEAGSSRVQQDHGGVGVGMAVVSALSVQMQPGPVVVNATSSPGGGYRR